MAKKQLCECSDPGCPCCHGSCARLGIFTMHRSDTEDETGTPMCEGCSADASDSGVFTEQGDVREAREQEGMARRAARYGSDFLDDEHGMDG